MQNNFIVQSKDNNLIQKSSSGGMFAELARYVLLQSGVVFGCEMVRTDNGFDVRHIYIEDEKELYRLQGSKYVQSRLGDTIKQAKEFLDEGRLVLFSGTPCQIAGLKAFLKQDYENLLTVDVSCTGTPSLVIFNEYIKFLELKYKEKIINFEFRNKQKMGWSCGNALITFENGKQKILYNNVSSYLNLFITQKIQNKFCQNCRYNGLERISDITLADAWGVEQEYQKSLKEKFNKNKGISLVLINTNKGTTFFNNINKGLIFEEINIIKLRKYNGPLNKKTNIFDDYYLMAYKNRNYTALDKLFKKRLGKKYYYYILKNHTPKFIKNVIKLFLSKKHNKVDVLLMSWYYWRNYGSILTTYALYKVIQNFGYSVKQIQALKPTGYAVPFAKKHFEQTEFCINNKYFEKLNEQTNTFVVGADNQLDYGAIGKTVYRNLLNFTDINSKKLLISGSFGSWKWNENNEIMSILENLYKRFDFISVRENIAQRNLKEKFSIDSDWFVDPVFFLDKSEYLKLANNANEYDYSNSIMSYVLYPNNEADKIIQYLNKDNRYKINYFEGNLNAPIKEKDNSKQVENWLKSILTSRYIVTDSFHCVAFSIILNKPVICIKNACDTSRFASIFEKFNINIPIYNSFDVFIKNKNTVVSQNWEIINNNISIERQRVLNIIKNELAKDIDKTEEQKNVEKIFLKQRKKYYKNQDIYYRKNAILYKLFMEPLFIPIIRFFKYRKVSK